MAKVKFSALVSEMRNKLNGSVFSKNRAGNYLRNKTTPVNPQTTFQQAVRQRLGNLSAGFRALGLSVIQAWNEAAVNFPYTDIFGDQKFLNGKDLYVKLNVNLANAAQSPITAPPLPVGFPVFSLTGATLTQAAGVFDSFTLATSFAIVPAGYTLLVHATDPINPGINFVKNRYRLLGAFTAADNEVNLETAYPARFGTTMVLNQRVFVKAVLISNTTGQQSVPVEVIATAVAST